MRRGTKCPLMNYELEFLDSALKEWNKLDPDLRTQIGKKLKQRLSNPHVVAALVRGQPDCYKIKLRKSGYRLVYKVEDDALVVLVITVGRRDKDPYKRALAIAKAIGERASSSITR